MKSQVRPQRGAGQEVADTSRIQEFLRMNFLRFTRTSTSTYPKNFVEEFNKVFHVMHAVGVDRVELAAYKLKSVARTWYDPWKERRDENVPHPNCACF